MTEDGSAPEDPIEQYDVHDLIEFVEDHEPVTAEELADVMGMDERRLEENLEKLAGKGILVSMFRADGQVWMKKDTGPGA